MILKIIKIFRPVLHQVERKINMFMHLLDMRFTYLAVLLFFLIGTVLIFLIAYLCRYSSRYDYYFWKRNAVFKSLLLGLILVTVKLIVRSAL